MLKPYSSIQDGSLGRISTAKYPFDLESPGIRRIQLILYRKSPKERASKQSEIGNMLAMNVIELTRAEWVSPVTFATKKVKVLRFCVHYRKHNAVTVRSSYSLPRMDGLIDSPGDVRVFSALDVNSGYWLIGIDKSDKEITVFTSRH